LPNGENQPCGPHKTYFMRHEEVDEMANRDSTVTEWFKRFRNRFGGSDGSDDDTDSSDTSVWERYGTWFQALVLVATAFGGAIVGFASTAANRMTDFLRASGAELLTIVWQILVGVTVVAVAVCMAVVVLGVRNM
jgi:hypothetical protein